MVFNAHSLKTVPFNGSGISRSAAIGALTVAAVNATIEAAGEVFESPAAQHASVLVNDVLRP